MIAFVEGLVDSQGPDQVVLNVGGVGFLVRTTARTAEGIGPVGGKAVLHTCFMIRDESPVLYGFETREERALFLELTSVSGVGPRLAVALLGALPPSDLAAAIVSGNTAVLSRIPGVGKKTAARLCVELSGKMEGYAVAEVVSGHGDAELIEALTALGYTVREAVDAARRVDVSADTPLESRIRLALRTLVSR